MNDPLRKPQSECLKNTHHPGFSLRAVLSRPFRLVLFPSDIVPEPGQGDLAGHRDDGFAEMPSPDGERLIAERGMGMDEGLSVIVVR